MKLIIIIGSPGATDQFARALRSVVHAVPLSKVLVSSDINVLIHQRRSANPPQYAVADVSNLSTAERATLYRHFPEACDVLYLANSLDAEQSRFLARTSL